MRLFSVEGASSGPQNCVAVDANPGSYPGEISWEVTSGGMIICKADRMDDVPDECCAPGGTVADVACNDSWGDGWNGGTLKLGDQEVCAGFSSGTSLTDSYTFGEASSYFFRQVQAFVLIRGGNCLTKLYKE